MEMLIRTRVRAILIERALGRAFLDTRRLPIRMPIALMSLLFDDFLVLLSELQLDAPLAREDPERDELPQQDELFEGGSTSKGSGSPSARSFSFVTPVPVVALPVGGIFSISIVVIRAIAV